MKNIRQRLDDATARIDKAIVLAGVIDSDSMPDALRDFLDDEDLELIVACFPDLPSSVVDAIEERDDAPDAFFDWMIEAKRDGFMLNIATPVMEPTGPNSRNFSWGYYRTRWVYGDTLAAAVKSGLKWVASLRADELREAGFAAPGGA